LDVPLALITRTRPNALSPLCLTFKFYLFGCPLGFDYSDDVNEHERLSSITRRHKLK
jgi:hypothetical protein